MRELVKALACVIVALVGWFQVLPPTGEDLSPADGSSKLDPTSMYICFFSLPNFNLWKGTFPKK